MAINPNVTRAIAVTPNRYKGVSLFQERAITAGQTKIDTYNTDLSTQFQALGQKIQGSSDDIEKTSAKLKTLQEGFKGMRAKTMSQMNGNAFQEFVFQNQNDPEIGIINNRKVTQDAFNASNLNNPNAGIFNALGSAFTQNSELINPNGTANENPTQDVITYQPLDVTTATQGLLTSAGVNIESRLGEESLNIDGYNVKFIEQGGVKTLDETDLYNFFDSSIKNSEAYRKMLASHEQQIQNADLLGIEPKVLNAKHQDEIQRYDAQARSMAKGASYTQEGFKYDQVDASKLNDGTNGNINSDNLNAVLVDTIKTRVPLESNPYLTKDPDEFEKVYAKVDTELNTMIKDVTYATGTPENPVQGTLEKNGNTGLYDILGGANIKNLVFNDKNGKPLEPDAKNALISNLIRYDNLTIERNSLMKSAMKETFVNESRYNNIINFNNVGLEEKANAFKKPIKELKQEYEDYRKNQALRPNPDDRLKSPEQRDKERKKLESLLPDFEKWLGNKNTLENKEVIDKVETKYKELFEKKRGNDIENIDFTFKDLTPKKDLGETRFSSLHPDLQNAIFQDQARQKTYDTSGYTVLSNASSVMDASGKQVNLNNENIFLREELTDGSLGEPIAVSSAKYTSLGYAVNPKSGNIVEAVQIEVLDDDKKDKKLKQLVYIESDNLNKLGAVIKGYGNATKVADFLNKSLNKNVNPETNQKDYFEDGAYGSATISKKNGEYSAIFLDKATGKSTLIQDKNIGTIVSSYQGFMYLNNIAAKAEEESLGK